MKSGRIYGSQKGSACLGVLLILFCVFALLLGGGAWFYCKHYKDRSSAAETKTMIQPPLAAAMKNYGVASGDAVFLRIIKEPKILELWMKPQAGQQYCLISQYPVVAMSGTLGPKEREGDGQAPEGFYRTHAGALNPNSKYHLSFNVCYPNIYDRALGRTGSFIMVHGSNKSIGCFAMGDPAIEEIYGLVESYVKTPGGALAGVPIHIYPFVPTQERLLREKDNPYYDFWRFMARAWNWTENHRVPAVVRFEGKEMRLDE